MVIKEISTSGKHLYPLPYYPLIGGVVFGLILFLTLSLIDYLYLPNSFSDNEKPFIAACVGGVGGYLFGVINCTIIYRRHRDAFVSFEAADLGL